MVEDEHLLSNMPEDHTETACKRFKRSMFKWIRKQMGGVGSGERRRNKQAWSVLGITHSSPPSLIGPAAPHGHHSRSEQLPVTQTTALCDTHCCLLWVGTMLDNVESW